MTSKEKAISIFNRQLGNIPVFATLICINEIIDLHKTISANPINDKYWQEVKKEIELL